MTHLFVSAAHKSSGKTTVSIGLCAALSDRGLKVQPYKKGPDYIDPMWLSRAAGSACFNLDFYTQSKSEILDGFYSRMANADIGVIEGNKGLFDGLDLDGSNSNAAMAACVQSPVILVLDSRGMTRGVAPLILGYQAFDSNINIAGVILNKLGGSRHESKLRAVVEHYTDVRVLGAVHANDDLCIDERHLGLIPSNEASLADQKIQQVGRLIGEQVDLDGIIEIAKTALVSDWKPSDEPTRLVEPNIKIGIARDDVFGFYYPDDLEELAKAGATLVPFSPLEDEHLPEVDALFIGGGFPEMQLDALAANQQLKTDIRDQVEAGLPVYAECGGLMYLANKIEWDNQEAAMVGVLPGSVKMMSKPQGRGYAKLKAADGHPWNIDDAQAVISAHEFHYSRIENLPTDTRFAYTVERGTGVDGEHDGIVYKNVLASYVHLRSVDRFRWARKFVEFVKECKHD